MTPSVVDAGPSPGAPGACLVWRLAHPRRAISPAIVGGGIGEVSWVLNMTVEPGYSRLDSIEHLHQVAARLQLTGRGVGLMTAVDVTKHEWCEFEGAAVDVTVGVRRPLWAVAHEADPDERTHVPGTINLVAFLPVRLTDAALVNAVATATEAKVQALLDHRVAGTGTATDAVNVLCPVDGDAELFGGPRSVWGERLARATYDAVCAGIVRQRS